MPFAPRPRSHILQRMLLLCLAALITTSCLDSEEAPTAAKRTPIPTSSKPPISSRPPATAEDQTWLIMLYQDADDEILEEDMINDLNEAELVGSSDRVQIVAQMDRYDGGYDGDGDWTSTKRFLIEQDDDLEQLNSTELDDLGEVNMADRDTLVDFVTWAAKAYPADKYALIMSDHGSGWPGGWSDPEPATSGRHDISLADSFGDMLFLMEIGDALKQIMAETDIGQFELIGFDACLMSSIEVYSAIAPYGRYAVASQEVEPTLGWAYAAFLQRLVDRPEIDGAQLSQAIVDTYIVEDEQIIDDEARAKYIERVYEYDEETSAEELAREELHEVTLTGVDLTAMPKLVGALNELVTHLASVEQKPVAAARRYAQAFETVFDEEQPKPYIDLGSFAQLLQEKLDAPATNAAVGELLAAIDQTVIDEKHGDGRAGATGISIHFPNSKLYKDNDAGLESYITVATTFAQESLWDDFLAFHYTKKALPTAVEQPSTVESAAQVSAPGADAISIAPITLSANDVTIKQPLLMQSMVSGDQIAFIYVFIGRLDRKTNTIRVMDMDFLEAEQTKEIGGVFYPDWGESGQFEIEFEWDARVFALDNGESSEIALFSPEDYGGSSDEAIYTVDGVYTTAKGKKSRRATLVFNNGVLIQVLGYSGNDNAGAIREITPKRGDRFTINQQWMTGNSPNNAEANLFTVEGETLVFGEDNFTWKEVAAPRGDYLVGFIAEDLDGNWYPAYDVVKRK